jgi:rubredoxin
MVTVIKGALILREYEGAYMNWAIYRRRCDSCGYVPPSSRPILVWLSIGGSVAYGTYHAESFVCPFCGTRQVVELRG